MLDLAREKNEYVRQEVSKADAIAYFTEKGDEYKLELLEDLQDGQITFYTGAISRTYAVASHIYDTGSSKQPS
ncbi:MAG: hypothetical protein R2795_11320 [Saprospiraceae bacterium]